MIDVIFKLKLVDKLHGNTAIDIGAHDTRLAILLKKNGFENITLLDKNTIEDLTDDFLFIQKNVSEFKPTTKYDLVIARHILPFTEKPFDELQKILQYGETIFFTFFGKSDDRKDIKLVSKNEIEDYVQSDPLNEILYRDEIQYRGKFYADKIINWHIFTYIVKRRNI